MTVLKVVFVLMLALVLEVTTASIQVADSISPSSSLSLAENNPTPHLRVDFIRASRSSSSSSSSGSRAATPLRVDIVDTNTMHEVTPPSTFRPDSMGERSSFGANEQDLDGQSPIDAVVYAFLGVVVLVLAVTGAVLYKKRKTSSPQESLGKDYRSYCPSPFDSARRASQQQVDDLYASVEFNTGQRATSVAIAAFPGEDDDELSNSYRTCSRVYLERISSGFFSLAATSNRSSSSSIESSIDNDAGTVASKMTTATIVLASTLQKQRINHSAMAEFEDSFVESDDEEREHTRGVTESSYASSELYASFVESETRSASEVSWSCNSSWSGSEVSSLDSTRATDVTLWSSSSSRSMSFRISDVYNEQPDDHEAEEHEQEQNHGSKDDETRLPTPTAIAVAAPPVAVVVASRCDSILLFKPIKPMRLLAPKRKTPLPPTAREHVSTREERQELQRIFDL